MLQAGDRIDFENNAVAGSERPPDVWSDDVHAG
jgi:hypothetical protein